MFFFQNKEVKQKVWLLSSVFLTSGLLFSRCGTISEKQFYLIRNLYLPAAGHDSPEQTKRRELRYLLYEKDDAEKYRKMLVSSKIVTTNIYLISEIVEVKVDKNKELNEE